MNEEMMQHYHLLLARLTADFLCQVNKGYPQDFLGGFISLIFFLYFFRPPYFYCPLVFSLSISQALS